MPECGLCNREIIIGTPHYSTMKEGKYIDVCAECAGVGAIKVDTVNLGVSPTPAPNKQPIPAIVEVGTRLKSNLVVGRPTLRKEKAMPTDEATPKPQPESRDPRISVEYASGGKVFHIQDQENNMISLSQKKAVKMARKILRIAGEK